MTAEGYTMPAYTAGKNAAIASREEGHVQCLEKHENPYQYGSEDWKLWNLGWNNEIMQNG